MKCTHCKCDNIESDDNFCWNCGFYTDKGYNFLKEEKNINMILKGEAYKTKDRTSTLFGLLLLAIISFAAMILIRGNDLFKPFIYLKKQATSYIYGYKTSIIKTDNKYYGETILNYNDAINKIKEDFSSQTWLCKKNIDIVRTENNIAEDYNIASISFCDMSYDETKKIEEVINKMYSLFPNISGALTNITITNAIDDSEYIARFQPMYQFVNINENLENFNKVNKTQILLNSYYFLNEEIINTPLEDITGEWYVKDATLESTIAHELGHYISFLILLKENNLENITLVTNNNYEKINNIIDEFNKGICSDNILNEALNNYNLKYHTNLDKIEFASTISKYASTTDTFGTLISDETIAEAIHDYYLHESNMSLSSNEIINIIKEKLI